MKVIKTGRAQTGWAKEIVCAANGGCRSTLLVEQADLWQTVRYVKDETDYYIHFKCGHCGVINTVEYGTVPFDLEIKGRK